MATFALARSPRRRKWCVSSSSLNPLDDFVLTMISQVQASQAISNIIVRPSSFSHLLVAQDLTCHRRAGPRLAAAEGAAGRTARSSPAALPRLRLLALGARGRQGCELEPGARRGDPHRRPGRRRAPRTVPPFPAVGRARRRRAVERAACDLPRRRTATARGTVALASQSDVSQSARASALLESAAWTLSLTLFLSSQEGQFNDIVDKIVRTSSRRRTDSRLTRRACRTTVGGTLSRSETVLRLCVSLFPSLRSRADDLVDSCAQTTQSSAQMPPPQLISDHRARMYGVAPADVAARWA